MTVLETDACWTQVDGEEPAMGEAWSVVVKGGAAHVKRAEEMIDPAGPKNHFLRIVPDEVSGCRFPIVDRSVWNGPLTPPRRQLRHQQLLHVARHCDREKDGGRGCAGGNGADILFWEVGRAWSRVTAT